MSDEDSDDMMHSMMGFSSFGTQRPAGRLTLTSFPLTTACGWLDGDLSGATPLLFHFVLFVERCESKLVLRPLLSQLLDQNGATS